MGRLTPEFEAVIREANERGYHVGLPRDDIRQLLAEVAALRAERDEARAALDAKLREPMPVINLERAQVSRHQWDLWLGTDHTLESLNAILAEDDGPALTPERVKELLKRAAAGSNELLKQTRQAFGLSQQSAGLRLGGASKPEGGG